MKMLLALLFTMSIFTKCEPAQSSAAHATSLPAATFFNVPYGVDSLQKMDVYLPANRTDSTPVLVLVHGGGWASGNKSEFATAIPLLQKRLPQYAICNINYRLATSSANHFPTQENDLKAALQFITNEAAEYQVSKDVVLLGASAGAHLAMLQAYKYKSPIIPKAVISFFGPADMAAMHHQQTNSYYKMGLELLVGGRPETKPSVYAQSSPINFVSPQSPPTLLLHGGRDGFVPAAQSKILKQKLEAAGVLAELVVYPNEGHGWYGATMENSIERVATFLKVHRL